MCKNVDSIYDHFEGFKDQKQVVWNHANMYWFLQSDASSEPGQACV